MPYIEGNRRDALNQGDAAATPGELNYKITKLAHNYLIRKAKIGYAEMNEVLGVMDAARQEFYRVVMAPYEDKKRVENGSVTWLDDFKN